MIQLQPLAYSEQKWQRCHHEFKKLICEVNEDINYITEEKEEDGKKSYFIEGVFMQGDIKNRNGRMYPSETLAKEVNRYNKEYVQKKRAYGELLSSRSTINLERVSHMITELKQDGSNFLKVAKIMTETPYGQIVKSLMDEGAQLGVSSRGMGSLKAGKNGAQEVQRISILLLTPILLQILLLQMLLQNYHGKQSGFGTMVRPEKPLLLIMRLRSKRLQRLI